MWLPFLSWVRKPRAPSPTVKVKLKSSSSRIADILSTSLIALKESADAFPVLKGAVGGALALWDIARRSKHSKKQARDIAHRAETVLGLITDAVPDGSVIPPPMIRRIERFTDLLQEIHRLMMTMSLTNRVSRIMHLNRNESTLLNIRSQLDNAYHDFLAASALSVEAEQARIASQQAEFALQNVRQQKRLTRQQAHTHFAVRQAVETTDVLASRLSQILFFSGLSVIFRRPWTLRFFFASP
ncbi:hypothetical protein B0H16DRAFT_1593787 [Mycena metata]|uniref:Uncharacterized protein n=1 Tax=Mycena metata TaxID=1033252 RepID=A0AAD7MP03_9AGAR|nr:hypothetical protein B0H16DRAFT_1593787 [Mycena metata]